MTSLSRLALRAGTAIALIAGLCGTALAQNTPSNTTIKNIAKLDYSVNGTPQPPICSKPGVGNTTPAPGGVCPPGDVTTFNVDTKVNLLVTTTDTTPIATTPGANGVMTFTVTNAGNSTVDVALTTVPTVAAGQTVFAAPNTATDSFDPTAASCVITDNAGTAIPGNKLSNVASGATVTVKVSCQVPATNGGAAFVPTDAALVALKAQALGAGGGAALTEVARVDAATPGVVLADAAGSDDAARDGFSSARSALKAAPAALNVAKVSAILCDPSNGNTNAKAIPGAYIRYTVTVTNGAAGGGQASANVTTLGDNLDPNVAYDGDFIVGTGPGTSCATAATTGTATSAAGSVEVAFTPAAGNNRASFAGGPKYVTTAAAVTGAVGSQVLSIPTGSWTTLLPAEGAYAAGELKPGDAIVVKYNVIIR